MSKTTTAPKYMVCGSNHSLRDTHKWSDTDIAHIRGAKEFKPKDIVATSNDNVATRRISIRELNQGISKHFTKLPFVVTRNGKDIAKIIEV